MIQLARQQTFDICYATGVEGALIGGWISRRMPLVYGEFHPYLPPSLSLNWIGTPFATLKRLYQLRYFYFTRHVAWQAAHVVVTSQFMQRQVEAVYHLPPRQITAIPTGVDTSTFRPPSVPAPFETQAVRFACVARLEPSKGIDILLEAFAKVLAQYPAVRLVIVGGGAIEPFLAQAHQLGIAEQVRFRGRLPCAEDVAEVLRQSHIFVLPSRVEGYGNVLLEAMTSRLAVIATRVGGIPEIVTDQQTGLLVAPEQPVELAAAMVKLTRDVALCEQLAEAGYRQVTEHGRFTWDVCVDAHCELFQRLLTERDVR